MDKSAQVHRDQGLMQLCNPEVNLTILLDVVFCVRVDLAVLLSFLCCEDREYKYREGKLDLLCTRFFGVILHT